VRETEKNFGVCIRVIKSGREEDAVHSGINLPKFTMKGVFQSSR